MIGGLRDKKVIFFDVGYTLDAPASGDWMLTGKFMEAAGAKMKQRSETEIQKAAEAGLRFLAQNHLVKTVDEEIRQFFRYYTILSDQLRLGLTEVECGQIAEDRACNMKNYVPYPGITEVLATLSRTRWGKAACPRRKRSLLTTAYATCRGRRDWGLRLS